jgi:hypothetical protein
MLYREIIAVCSEAYTKDMAAKCRRFNVKLCGTFAVQIPLFSFCATA